MDIVACIAMSLGLLLMVAGEHSMLPSADKLYGDAYFKNIHTAKGFSFFHIVALVFCFAAGSGALLLLFSLIYCRSKNTDTSTIWKLQLSLVFFPNICLFFAFLHWGFTEGSLNETVTCCALYILRPIMLIWALPCLKYLQDNLKPWISFFTISRELAVFTIVVYSVLFYHGWTMMAHNTDIMPQVRIGVLFGMVVLLCLILSADVAFKKFNLFYSCSFLSVSQLLQLVHSFGIANVGPIVAFICALFMPFLLHLPAVSQCLRGKCTLFLWIITMSPLVIVTVIYADLGLLAVQEDCLEWICVIVLLEVLKMIVVYAHEKQKQQTEESQQESKYAFHLCHEIMYMFGAVGVVLLSSVTLMTELILKARNGERVIEDLRIIVFPSECAFALYWLVLEMQAYWKVLTTGSAHSPSHQVRWTFGFREMDVLPGAVSILLR